MFDNLSFECSLPISQYPYITMAHGGGGKLTQHLIDHLFRPAFTNHILEQQHDSSLIHLPGNDIAVTTDSYVIYPLFFPDSNIGELAITGTVNDLAMRGAKPLYITCGFILPEGLEIEILIKVVDAMRLCAIQNNIKIIAGDIKVIDRQPQQSLFINTTGMGIVEKKLDISPTKIQSSDAIIISNDIGRHGLAVLSAREGLDLTPPITSDCCTLWPMVQALLEESVPIHCLRDLTRGGLSAALIELAKTTQHTFEINESAIPLQQNVHAGCELLGLDPLFVANEGCMIVILPQIEAENAVEILRKFNTGKNACQIGSVTDTHKAQVILKTTFGSQRRLHLLSGEQLPRIC